jgi:hypothetical protein
MKKLLCLIPLLLCLGAFHHSELIDWRFRKVGDKYWDIGPSMKWWDSHQSGKKPQPEWNRFYLKKVVRIIDEGVIVEGGADRYSTMLIKNFPDKSKLVDNDSIDFWAIRTGSFKHYGETLEQWDCGICYDPTKKGPDGKAKLLQ